MKRAHGQGTVEQHGGRLYWRIRRENGTRPYIPVRRGISKETAGKLLEEFIRRRCEKGDLEEAIDRLIEQSPRTKRGRLAAKGKLTSVREVGEAWTSGALLKTYGPVNGLRPMGGHDQHNTSGYNMNAVLQHVYRMRTRDGGPGFGDLPAREVVHTDIAKVMAKLGGAAGSRNHVHNYLSRILALAEIPLGLREPGTNPVLKAYRAPKDPDKLFNCLYPPELLAVLGNEKIFLPRRLTYLLSHYWGWRLGTLAEFDWSGVDWKHGTVSVLWQKGHQRLGAADDDQQGVPIFFRADPSCVLAVLRAWWERSGSPESGPVIGSIRGPEDVYFREGHDEAEVFRADLRSSGIERAILFSQASNVQKIRFHDGRAAFCTWARRLGKDDLWIKERTGHTPTSQMLDRYTRMARSLADLDYEPFPDVTSAIPELTPAEPRACPDCAARQGRTATGNVWPTTWPTRSQTVANGHEADHGSAKKAADRVEQRPRVPVEVLAPERASGFKSPPSHKAENKPDRRSKAPRRQASEKGRVGQDVGQTAAAPKRAAATLLEQAAALMREGATEEAEALMRAAQGLVAPKETAPPVVAENVVPFRQGRKGR